MVSIYSHQDSTFKPAAPGNVLKLPGLPGSASNTYDRSPCGNNGTVTGATWVRSTGGLWCLSFDGVDDVVDCGVSPSFDFGVNDFTLKAWIKTAIGYYFIGKGDGSAYLEFYLYGDGRLYARISDGTHSVQPSSSSNNLNNNLWRHCVLSADRDANIMIFIDGKVDGTPAGISAVGDINNSQPLTIGHTDKHASYHFSGQIALPEIVKGKAWNALDVQRSFQQEKHLFGVW